MEVTPEQPKKSRTATPTAQEGRSNTNHPGTEDSIAPATTDVKMFFRPTAAPWSSQQIRPWATSGQAQTFCLRFTLRLALSLTHRNSASS